MAVFITSDLHLWHSNIAIYCNRPFIEKGYLDSSNKFVSKWAKDKVAFDMNRELVKRWNETVKPDDTVYNLGDVAMISNRQKPALSEVLWSLNGEMHLIRGNHDKNIKDEWFLDNNFKSVQDYLVVHGVMFCHYPLFGKYDENTSKKLRGIVQHYQRIYKKERCNYLLYGHDHDTQSNDLKRSYNVACDLHDLKPIPITKSLLHSKARKHWM